MRRFPLVEKIPQISTVQVIECDKGKKELVLDSSGVIAALKKNRTVAMLFSCKDLAQSST